MERGGRQCVEMENSSNRNLSIFSNYSVLRTAAHFSIFRPHNY